MFLACCSCAGLIGTTNCVRLGSHTVLLYTHDSPYSYYMYVFSRARLVPALLARAIGAVFDLLHPCIKNPSSIFRDNGC